MRLYRDFHHGPERWADDMRRQRILERVGWSFWRCFGSNYRIDQEGVMDDLTQTLERMQIKPIGRETVNRSFSEHRVIPPVVEASSEAAATHAGGQFRSRLYELIWIQLRMTRKRTIDWLRVTALSFGIWTRSITAGIFCHERHRRRSDERLSAVVFAAWTSSVGRIPGRRVELSGGCERTLGSVCIIGGLIGSGCLMARDYQHQIHAKDHRRVFAEHHRGRDVP